MTDERNIADQVAKAINELIGAHIFVHAHHAPFSVVQAATTNLSAAIEAQLIVVKKSAHAL
jgi:hypothetical protein